MHHLQPAIVNDQVFPNVATGFGDTLPAMREQTVKVFVSKDIKIYHVNVIHIFFRCFQIDAF